MNKRMSTKPDLPVFMKLFLAVIASVAIFGMLVIVLLVGFQIIYTDRIYPGVYVDNIDLSGLTVDEAYQTLAVDLPYTYQGQIQLTYGDQKWDIQPIDLGYLIDPSSSAQEAFAVGRHRWLFPNLIEKGRAWFTGVQLSLVAYYDERVAQLYLNSLAEEIDVPMVEASLELENTEVLVRNGQVGHQLDIDQTLDLIEVVLSTMQDATIPLVVNESVPVILDASAQADLARVILSEPLVLTASGSGESWTIQPEDLATMLTISRAENGGSENSSYEININEDLFGVYLSSLVPELHVDPANTRFIFNDDTRQLEVIEPAVIGRDLNVAASITMINDQLKAGQHAIALQFDTLQPEVTDDMTGEDLGITELVIQETSYFYGSDAARVQNIETAAAEFHGLLIAPGETFSMASAMGDVSLENGYAEALIIYGDQTIQGVGGGVCQVSTTLFRTAFFAGLPIVERHAHAYRVGYYEMTRDGSKDDNLAGLDATVYVPIVDLKFTNDTGHWLLMETYMGQYFSLTWKFYGTIDGREVDWNTTGPTNVVPAPEPLYRENPELDKGEIKKVDYAADGADISITRTVYKDDKVYFSDSFYTHFQAWQAVFEYGPGTEDIPKSDSN
jgi:vancomycin resistance protein YoaR